MSRKSSVPSKKPEKSNRSYFYKDRVPLSDDEVVMKIERAWQLLSILRSDLATKPISEWDGHRLADIRQCLADAHTEVMVRRI